MTVVLEHSTRYRIVIFKFELQEQLDLPDNIVCYVDDISIPHTWRTSESHNEQFYTILKNEYINYSETTYNWIPYALNFPEGSCSGSNLVTAIRELLNGLDENFTFEVVYNPARGTVNIEEKPEDIHANSQFLVPSDFGIMSWMSNTGSDYPWRNIDGTIKAVDINNLQYINGVLRKTQMIHFHQLSGCYKSYESGFIDLLNAHNIYFHCHNLGRFNSIGVRSENTIIKQKQVSSSFGYLIIGSVVAPHDKMNVSRQLIKTIQCSLKCVCGNTINLHGAHCSFSLIFVTMV